MATCSTAARCLSISFVVTLLAAEGCAGRIELMVVDTASEHVGSPDLVDETIFHSHGHQYLLHAYETKVTSKCHQGAAGLVVGLSIVPQFLCIVLDPSALGKKTESRLRAKDPWRLIDRKQASLMSPLMSIQQAWDARGHAS